MRVHGSNLSLEVYAHRCVTTCTKYDYAVLFMRLLRTFAYRDGWKPQLCTGDLGKLAEADVCTHLARCDLEILAAGSPPVQTPMRAISKKAAQKGQHCANIGSVAAECW